MNVVGLSSFFPVYQGFGGNKEPTGVYNVGTEQAYYLNEMIKIIDDALGTDVDPIYIECPFDAYVDYTMADISNLREATDQEPEIVFAESFEYLYELHIIVDAHK